jgi:hypothetical protein
MQWHYAMALTTIGLKTGKDTSQIKMNSKNKGKYLPF